MLDTEIPTDFWGSCTFPELELPGSLCSSSSISSSQKTHKILLAEDSVNLPYSVPAAIPNLQHKVFSPPGMQVEYPGILDLLEMGMHGFHFLNELN